MPYIYSLIVIAALYFLVRYWDKKTKKELKDQRIRNEEKKYFESIFRSEEVDKINLDISDRFYHTDEREVEHYKK